MNVYTIDTSALVKYVLTEEYSDAVDDMVSLHRSAAIQLIAPDYVLVECASVLWQRVQRGDLDIGGLMPAFSMLQAVGIRLFPQSELLEEALLFAASAGIAVYDALFCVLARQEDAPLITDDGPLVNRSVGTGIRALTLAEWAGIA
jgi:predicted nucleic acid-binding protein